MHYSNRRRPVRREKPKSSFFSKFVLASILIFILQFFYFGFWITPSTDTQNSVTISILPGEGLKDITQKLKEENVINSKLLFISYAKRNNFDTRIQSGVFRIPLPQTIPSALEILTTVPAEDRITIPEGYRIKQIDELLANRNLIIAGQFEECIRTCQLDHPVLEYIPSQTTRNLEGFLFPDTYFINTNNFSSESLIIQMLNNFQRQLPSDWQEKAQNLPRQDLYSIINMASIIEREVLRTLEKQMVSGILWKRYRSDWLIDADAALLYVKEDNIITRADLQSDSPYNIRRFKGLPPTPISNPGLRSIEAALNPIESQYWFYLTTLDTGEVIYARTNDEHNQNRFKYLR